MRSFQWLTLRLSDVGHAVIGDDRREVLAALDLALLCLADLRRGGPSAKRRGRGALDAGVHVGAVVVADVDHVVPALHGPGERLESDVVGPAVAAERHELHSLVRRDLAGALKALECGLDARDRRSGVLERVVDEGHTPRRVRVDRGRHLEAAGRAPGDHGGIAGCEQDLPHRDRRTATGTQTVAAGEAVRVVHKLFQSGHLRPS